MSTSIKIWILATFVYLLHLFGSQNILTTFIWIPKLGPGGGGGGGAPPLPPVLARPET